MSDTSQNNTENKQDYTGKNGGKVLNPEIIWYKIHFGSEKQLYLGETQESKRAMI